jgi:hypothetical protein
MQEKPPRYILFSIDTEPDAPQWRGYDYRNLTFENIEGIQALLARVEEYGIRPTFLVTCSMALQARLRSVLEPLVAWSRCEIGAHFHPGDTPPFANSPQSTNDNILKIPDGLLAEKFESLHATVTSVFGVPRSYRSGAWTIDSRIVNLLTKYGYGVDSSVTPGISWRALRRPSYVGAPRDAYYLDSKNPGHSGNSGVLELPVTIWSPSHLSGLGGELLAAVCSMPLESRRGILFSALKKYRPYRPLWLRPALSTLEEMVMVAEKSETDFIHIMCHSNELSLGTSPYSDTPEKLRSLMDKITRFFSYANRTGFVPLTLSEYERRYSQRSRV